MTSVNPAIPFLGATRMLTSRARQPLAVMPEDTERIACLSVSAVTYGV
jgi:hypothetical protein